ncbi:hypothetical protein UPYG_G00317870 [Umbra pygmaea]|uniref:Leucine-rich repeat flightless-interacting protein 1-like n=1 Tax=Umbra pygmaea TaxID=75934 RepID=A0ABD0W019_UMBPY
MKELERQQKEEDSERYTRPIQRHTSISDDDEQMSVGSRGSVRDDKDYLEKGSRTASTLSATTLGSLGGSSSRRGSGETSLTGDTETSIREIKEIHELKDQIQDVESKYMQSLKEVKDVLAEVEEKYRKAMVSNAQLDNEKNNLMYQVDTLKDSLMELEELLSESRRECQEKTKECEREKHAHGVLQFQFNSMKETLKQSEELLTEIRQMRLKQDGLVREISDLQETVDWKDKKIGALERQKEYSDAIRNERDELRDEVVQLKDIVKKHGIVLGPDLTTNGDILDAGTEGSASRDPASQLAQDSQMPPMEGSNSMLGRAEEMELEGRGGKVMEPGMSIQHEDAHEEEARENSQTSITPCGLAGVTKTETYREPHPFSPTLVDEVEIDSSKVKNDKGIPSVVEHGLICNSQVHVVVTGSEEEVTVEGHVFKAAAIEGTGEGEVEDTNDWGMSDNAADYVETKVTKDNDGTKDTSSKEPTSEYSGAAEPEPLESCRDVIKQSESCPQDVVNHGTQLQTEPQNTKKVKVLVDTPDPQVQAQGGKKKKKGKKKKAVTHDNENQEDIRSTTEKDVVSIIYSTHTPESTDHETTKRSVELNPEPQTEPLKINNTEAQPETKDTNPQFHQDTDLDASTSPVKSNIEPQFEPFKIKHSEELPEITDTYPPILQDIDLDTSKSPVESKPVNDNEPLKTTNADDQPETTGTHPQIIQDTDLETSKSTVESQPEAQTELLKLKNAEALPEITNTELEISQDTEMYSSKSTVESKPQSQSDSVNVEALLEPTDTQSAQGGKKKRKSKKKGEKHGHVKQEGNQKSKTGKDVSSTPLDKEVVVELVEVCTIEAQQIRKVENSSSPDGELQRPNDTLQTTAEDGCNLKQGDQKTDEEVKEEELPLEKPEVVQPCEIQTEEFVTKRKRKKMKKDQQKPSMESDASDCGTSLLCNDQPVEDSTRVIQADNPKEELEATTTTANKIDKFTPNPDNSADCLDFSADTECASDIANVAQVVTVSLEEVETFRDTRDQRNNCNSPKDLLVHDCLTSYPDNVDIYSALDQDNVGQDKKSPVEHFNEPEHDCILIALPSNVEKCYNSSEEELSSPTLENIGAETVNLPEQLADCLSDCPVADEQLNKDRKQETLAGEASSEGTSSETKLSNTETQPQEPAKETLETIVCFTEQNHDECGPCTVVVEAEEQEDHIETKLEGTGGPSNQDIDEVEEDDENDEGQPFDFDDLDSEILPNVPVQDEISQEVRVTSEGEEIFEEDTIRCEGKEEEDREKLFVQLQDMEEHVSTIAGEQSLEEASEELRSPEEKSKAIVKGENANEEQDLIAVQEAVSVTYPQKDNAEEGVSVSAEEQVEVSERIQNATDIESFPVEEGEEAIQYGSQQGSRDSIQSTQDSADGNSELSSTNLKKGSKKGKGKGKEDCRMS